MTRLSDPMPLSALPASLRDQLPRLCARGGGMRKLLASPGDALCVVALEAEAVGWAAAEPSGLLSVYVAPRRRREGIGEQLVRALWPAARQQWPDAQWTCQVAPGSAGAVFWAAMDARVMQVAWRWPERTGA